MRYVIEVEVYDDGDLLTVDIPDFNATTQGEDLCDAIGMATDLVIALLEDRILTGGVLPAPSPLGRSPRFGGTIVVIAVDVSRASIPAVSASKAAELLGVSRARVSQLLRSGRLEGYREGRDTFVTRASLRARIDEAPTAGRPRKTPAHS